MTNYLSKVLKKLGANDFSELSQEEKDTYRNWESILSGRKLTDQEVQDFLSAELEDALNKNANPAMSQREDVFVKMKIEFIRKIKVFLMKPEIEKRMVEKTIENL